MQPVNEEVRLGELAFLPDTGEPPEYVSPLLGLRLVLDETGYLRFFDEATGQRLLTDEEARQQAEERAASRRSRKRSRGRKRTPAGGTGAPARRAEADRLRLSPP